MLFFGIKREKDSARLGERTWLLCGGQSANMDQARMSSLALGKWRKDGTDGMTP